MAGWWVFGSEVLSDGEFINANTTQNTHAFHLFMTWLATAIDTAIIYGKHSKPCRAHDPICERLRPRAILPYSKSLSFLFCASFPLAAIYSAISQPIVYTDSITCEIGVLLLFLVGREMFVCYPWPSWLNDSILLPYILEFSAFWGCLSGRGFSTPEEETTRLSRVDNSGHCYHKY